MEEALHGNIAGLSKVVIAEIETLYTIKTGKDEFATQELLEAMAAYTQKTNREISVLIARDGTVRDVSIGHYNRAEIPQIRTMRSITRLSGVRCLHTHPNAPGVLSEVDIHTLQKLRLDSMAAVGVRDGKPQTVYAAYLTGQTPPVKMIGPIPAKAMSAKRWMEEVYEADRLVGRFEAYAPNQGPPKTVLVGMGQDGMEELAELAKTAGYEVVRSEVQNKAHPDASTYVGRGKVMELAAMRGELGAEVFVFDEELSPLQIRNLEAEIDAKILDRTALILEIFSMRAESREGKLQVELAQLQYMLPRLTGQGKALSRQGGGRGTRMGGGEAKLEIDKRRIRRRIYELKEEIRLLTQQRQTQRGKRLSGGVPTIALVGYTNAGKSTLLNQISGADALAEDKLFATLDPLTRRANLDGQEVLLTDTVGFVQKLPHELVDAFRSTLEEAVHADLLLHVVDSAHPEKERQIEVVDEVLHQLNAHTIPRLLVYNKADVSGFAAPKGAVAISAKTGQGIETLYRQIREKLSESWWQGRLLIPYAKGEVLALIRTYGAVESGEYLPEGTSISCRLPAERAKQIQKQLS